MLYAFPLGSLELRAAADVGVSLRGVFPYGKTAVLSDGGRSGRPKKEMIGPNAFGYRVNKPDEDIHLLSGHDYNKPLASKLTGTLDVVSDDRALSFVARIAPEIFDTEYGKTVLAQLKSNLATGLSPGFRLPPSRQVKLAERISQEAVDPENDMYGATLREVLDALLYEVSVVTVGAYPEAQVEEQRNWNLSHDCHVRRRKLLLL